MEILKCEGVRKVYGVGANQVVALDGIDLSDIRVATGQKIKQADAS